MSTPLFFMQGTRLLKNFISETDAHVKSYNDIFDELLQQFRDKAVGNTLVVVHRIWERALGLKVVLSQIGLFRAFSDTHDAAEDLDLNSIPYVGGAGSTRGNFVWRGPVTKTWTKSLLGSTTPKITRHAYCGSTAKLEPANRPSPVPLLIVSIRFDDRDLTIALTATIWLDNARKKPS
jgi:hypothetical protein